MSSQTLSLRTKQGPVGLREKRKDLQRINVRDAGEQTVTKNWLSGQKGKAVDEGLYHHCVKQAMLIGARAMELNDVMDPSSTRDDADQIQAKIRNLESGQEKINITGHKKLAMKKIAKQADKERHLLVKYSKRCCCDRRERSFIIENGEIVVYKSQAKNAKISYPSFKMKDAQIYIESRMPGTYQRPRFDEGYTDRMRVVFPERVAQGKNPFYLYPRDQSQLNGWKRAFQLARVLVSDNDRRVLKVAIGRASAASLVKGWESTVFYYKEIADTRRLVKQMALRLMKVDFSRGWTKMRLVNRRITDNRAKRQEQQLWAARFMSEKLARLGTQNAKKASDVRETVITRIQQRFRHYRDEKIFDRQYPIGSKIVSRMRQARQGCQMDVALDVLTCEECLLMNVTDQRTLEKYKLSPEMLNTKKSTYSEVNIPAAEMLLSVADNLQSLAFTAPTHTTDAWSHLTKSDWSNFVNLDRISQVVLHTAPHLAVKRKEPLPKGVWCTVYGPKISRGKRIDVVETKEGKQISCNVVGTADGFAVQKALSSRFPQDKRGTGIKWVKFQVTVEGANWTLDDGKAKAGAPNTPPPEEEKTTQLHLHVLGFRFTSKPTKDKRYSFESNGVQASVPVAADDAAMVALDSSVLGVEVVELTQTGKPPAPLKEDRKVILAGAETLWTVYQPKEGSRMQSYTGAKDYDLLVAPPEIQDGAKAMGSIKLKITCTITDDSPERDEKCVSPELVGSGILTSLYSSHRGCWHDAELGPGQFRLDHVGNFVELVLSAFRFPNNDEPPKEGQPAPNYRIRATCCGIRTETPPMYRATRKWLLVLGSSLADPFVVKFNGNRLCLPLPPGCFGITDQDQRPKIELEVIKCEHQSFPPQTYEEFAGSEGRRRSQEVKEDVIYRTSVSFDGMLVDQVKQVSAFFAHKGSKGTDDVVCDVFTNMVKKGKPTEALLNIDFALRDRDYIKTTTGQPPGDQKTVCVGDKAVMLVEEPLLYPLSKNEFRSRFVQGQFKQGEKYWPKDKERDRGAKLREPCLSSEYSSSGLGEMVPKVPFKQSVIPNYCTDIIPHKFVLPLSEQQFREERRAGVWPRILDDLAATKEASGAAAPRGNAPPKTVVDYLTHITRQLPVMLLATYPDGTADVEVAASFMKAWSEQKERRYSLPGILVKAPVEPPPPKPGQKPPAGPPPFRAILKKVPIKLLTSVHATGFHVYDTEYKSIDDLRKVPLPNMSFSPKDSDSPAKEIADMMSQFSIQAGPLPADASTAACQYEWCLHVRAPDDQEMSKFVAMLRQCVRVDHHQQSTKMVAYQSKPNDALAIPPQVRRQMIGGQLEVVLVEARRLQALGIDKKVSDLKASVASQLGQEHLVGPLQENKMQGLQGTTGGEASKSTPSGSDIATFVSFRMVNDEEVIAFKSQKVQHSPIVRGTDSPSWASVPELLNSGGWTFKTGLIDPEKYPKLEIQFEVMQFSMGMSQTIGAIHLPCNANARPRLTNPREPFRNLWVPLLSVQNGRVAPNKTGEIHIMTRWLPTEKLYLPPGQQQVSVRSHFLKELWPKVCAQRVKEPIYSLEAQYLHYNPNLVRNRVPESPADHVRRHTEDLHNNVPYLECMERRQDKRWQDFESRLQEEGLSNIRMGELRLKWTTEGDSSHLDELQALVEGGISSERRERMWLDLTMASRVLDVEGLGQRREQIDPESNKRAAEEDYRKLLEVGLPQRSDANQQLQEDAFHLAAWESSTPPVAELLDFHLRRLKKAQNVCTALIAFDKSGVAYCESLLIVAFFLLLPQGFKEDKEEDGVGQMHYMSESSAFWLLYTLVGTRVNGTYKEYYGRPDPVPQPDGQPPKESLCVTSGAMHDVALLECCLAYHEHDLWCVLNRIGFQLSTVFYGAFMRLYCTYMPTATVFRFWDLLFSQSSDHKAQPHGRSYLIDLAFGIIRVKRSELMQCESALEARTLIMGAFGSLYDTSTVVEMTLSSHKFLWGGGGFSFGKVGHLWTQREDLFKGVNDTFAEQNDVLRVLTHERSLGRIPQTKYESPPNTKGVTTKELLKDVLPVMQQAFETLRQRSQGSGRHWAMHRPMPLGGASLCENSMQKAMNILNHTFKGKPLEMIPCMVGPPTDSGASNAQAQKAYPGLEPLDITSGDMATVLQKDIPNWSNLGQHLWRTFTNRRDAYQQWKGPHVMGQVDPAQANQPQFMNWIFGNKQNEILRQQQANAGIEERVSLNELFIALICCSRGTLGDKASALFNIYSYVEPMTKPPEHHQPLARLAKSITKTADGSGEHTGKNLTPPDPETIKQNALHLQVWSNYPAKNTFVGEVFIPTLGSFVGYNPNEAEVQSYNIWGPYAGNKERNNQELSNQKLSNAAPQNVTGEKVVVGDLEMALTWTPKTIKQPEIGQLCIRLKSIRFYKMYVSEYFKMNPRVTVHTYLPNPKTQGNPIEACKLPRWDPRGVLGTDQHHSWLTTSGAYGGNIDFEPTMKEGLVGHGEHFRHWIRHGADMGFNPDTEEWCWNETWGKQFSAEDVRMQKEFMSLSQRKNVMDMHGVRHIVTGILNRSMLNVTNRQAMLIADTLFNRQGAVPGILEAVIVTDEHSAESSHGLPKPGVADPALSLKLLKDFWQKHGKMKGPIDVTNQIVLEHERQVQRFGFMNLFHESFMVDFKQRNGNKALNLKDMNINDPFPHYKKSMWIRYVRSGDGERCTQGLLVDSSGEILSEPSPEIKLDLAESWPQTKVTKEEFISCMLNSPMLGESLRRIGATDHVLHPKKAIPLDVTVMDPHQEEEDQQFMDAIDVGQSVLIEVWDADVGSKDFLGEVWLPPLSSLSSQPKDYVLPLKKADMSEEAENGPSRESKHKDLGSGADEKKITGELYVRLAWKYPAYDVDEVNKGGKDGEGEDIATRAKNQEKLHTGKLTFLVMRAQQLRRADAAKGRDCDPQVTAWVRNDTVNQWRKKPLARTGVIRNNRNPKWQNEFKEQPFDIMTGSYEARFPPKQDGWFEELKTTFRSRQAKRHIKEDREMNAIKRYGTAGLKMKFLESLPTEGASNSQDGGDNHRVEVFLGDTIREFKAKLTSACDREAEFWANKGNAANEAKFKDVRVSYKHLVMVFVPSPKVQRLYAQKLHEGAEYKHAYNQAIQDPSSWQPLDPTRTFGQYPQFGFGRKQAQLLRIVEASEAYKLVNLRYKEFEKEQSKKGYKDTNEDERCYGFAKYWHACDCGPRQQPTPAPAQGNQQSQQPPVSATRDYEWRPAYIYKGSPGAEPGAARYQVKWVFEPATNAGLRSPREQKQLAEGRQEMGKADVLLAPRCPLIDVYVHPDHHELLEQAKTFRQIGKSDWEIEVMLNKSLDDKIAAEKGAGGTTDASRPPRITVDIIRNYLQRREAVDANKTGGAAAAPKAIAGPAAPNAPSNASAPSNAKK